MPRTAVFTICARNYIHYSKVLFHSVQKQHPEWDRFLLLADKMEGLDVSQFDCNVYSINDLRHPDIFRLLFRYNVLEFCTAVKPRVFDKLFREGYDRVIYLDPDIFVYQKMSEVEKAFDDGNFIVLTPHLTGFLDDKKPDEHDILLAGAYNLGFLGLARHRQLDVFIKWWRQKLEYNCIIDINNGYFVDQKWFDLIPGLFGDVKIIRHPGYNTAYWNLGHRRLTEKNNAVYACDQPLVFYHFSGLNPQMPENISRHQDRFHLSNHPVIKKLFLEYIEKLHEQDLKKYREIEYGYSRFQDGIIILDIIRQCCRSKPDLLKKAGKNPFENSSLFLGAQYRKDKTGDNLPIVSELMLYIWESRPDLQSSFPDIKKRNRAEFCEWFIRAGNMPDEYTGPARKSFCNYQNNNSDSPKSGKLKRMIRFFILRIISILYNMPRSVKKIFPESLKKLLKKRLANWQFKNHKNFPPKHLMPGVNIIGYVRAEMGIGEVSRITAKALNCTDIPFGLFEHNFGNNARTEDFSWAGKETKILKYNTNVFAMNADGLLTSNIYLAKHISSGQYNIGYWAWELPDFPEEWTSAFQMLDEVWVLSDFILKSVSLKATVPVLTMPLAIEVAGNLHYKRKHFNLPEKSFLFLTMYDTHSFHARKNPQGAIAAFQKAFNPKSGKAGLVIKINNPQSNLLEVELIRQMIEGWPNIY